MSTDRVEPWKELSRETVFEKYGRKIDQVIFEKPDGTRADYYIKHECETVCVLALTKKAEVILTEQFRPGPKKILLELPGGFMEEGEEPLVAATRELLEETGYAGTLRSVTSLFDCAYSTRIRYCFVATDCRKTDLASSTEGKMTTHAIPLEAFLAILRSGQLTDAGCAYAALDVLRGSELAHLADIRPNESSKNPLPRVARGKGYSS